MICTWPKIWTLSGILSLSWWKKKYIYSVCTNVPHKNNCKKKLVDTTWTRHYYFIQSHIFHAGCSAVAFPMKIKLWVSTTRMIVSVTLICILVFFISNAIAAHYTRGTFFNSRTNTTTYRTQTVNSKKKIKIFWRYTTSFWQRYFCVISLSCLSSCSTWSYIVILQRRNVWRKKTDVKKAKSDDKTQTRITRMLLIIAGICLLCTAPGSIFLLAYRLVDGFELFGKCHNIFLVRSGISTLLTMINSSVNFIIYMVFNKQFAEVYRR